MWWCVGVAVVAAVVFDVVAGVVAAVVVEVVVVHVIVVIITTNCTTATTTNAIITFRGSHHKNNDVRNCRTVLPHRMKRLVTCESRA